MTNIIKDLGWVTPIDMEIYYVYELIDLHNRPFYIGKGKGYRINNHVKPSSLKESNYKNYKIKSIIKSQGHLKRRVLRYFKYSEEALLYENNLLKLYGVISMGGTLTNVISDNTKLPAKAYDPALKYICGRNAAKLSDREAVEINQLWESKIHTQKELSIIYGVGDSTVSSLLRGKQKCYLGLFPYVSRPPIKRLSNRVKDAIKESFNSGLSVRDIMAKFSISKTHTYRIIRTT